MYLRKRGLNETGNPNMNWSNLTRVFKYSHTCIYHWHRNLLVEGVTPLVSQVSLSRDAGLWCVARWWLSAHRASGPFMLDSLTDIGLATAWSTHWDDSQYPFGPEGPGGPGTPGIPGTPAGPLRPSRPLLPYAGSPGSPEPVDEQTEKQAGSQRHDSPRFKDHLTHNDGY